MKLTTIGTGTGAPHPLRVCSGHLVEAADVMLLMDCGNAVMHRMATLGVPWGRITHVAITHFHADHIADLPMLLFAMRWGQLPPRADTLVVIGPPGLQDLLDRLAAAFGTWVRDPGFPVQVIELAPGSSMSLGTEHVMLSNVAVPHTAESVAYSITHQERRLVYTGDTPFDTAVAEWARGCDVLLAECSLPDSLAIPEHLTPRQAGAFAAIANPSTLVLTHLYPPLDAVDVPAEVAEHYAGNVVIATDGFSIEL